jgi:alpha-tubulin suppressor-like RCC1 family protein
MHTAPANLSATQSPPTGRQPAPPQSRLRHRLRAAWLALIAGLPLLTSIDAQAQGIAAGEAFTCAIVPSGHVECWGRNQIGQLGQGWTSAAEASPRRLPGLSQVTAITSGPFHSCARIDDGTLRCWGNNYAGQLGNGLYSAPVATPAPVTGITDAIAVSAGGYHSCAVTGNGNAWCWGDNGSGQLGNGSSTGSSPQPVAVVNLADITMIATGNYHSCALDQDGIVYCWGSNSNGQLGTGTTDDSAMPVLVAGLPAASAISTGSNHSCALTLQGTVYCWGHNFFGQLGNGSNTSSPTPVPVTGLIDALAVHAGWNHTCAIRGTGAAVCWGPNGSGQIGTGTALGAWWTPQMVLIDAAVVDMAGGDAHTCARLLDGTLHCWGKNLYGQLGQGELGLATMPTPVVGAQAHSRVTAGARHTCSLKPTGAVACWGDNSYQQLGNGFGPASSLPVDVGGLASVTSVATGRNHTCAVSSAGHVDCWGQSDSGQLGDGNQTSPGTPVRVSGLSDASAVTAGGSHSCALRANGTIVCWGGNAQGQLGDGSYQTRLTPVPVSGITDAVAVTAGTSWTCALRATGAALCWGSNQNGELGSGSNDPTSAVPLPVAELADIASISAGNAHTCATTGTGLAACWGANWYGNLGTGDFQDSMVPQMVPGLSDVQSISAGDAHSCALRGDGSAACWGANWWGELGTGSLFSYSVTPVNVVNLVGATGLSSGGSHTCAATEAGLHCWGNNLMGQLGNGRFGHDAVPTPVRLDGLFDHGFELP